METDDTDEMYRQIKNNVKVALSKHEDIASAEYITLDEDGWYKLHVGRPICSDGNWLQANKRWLLCYTHRKGGANFIAKINLKGMQHGND